jgi:hypothetical protein
LTSSGIIITADRIFRKYNFSRTDSFSIRILKGPNGEKDASVARVIRGIIDWKGEIGACQEGKYGVASRKISEKKVIPTFRITSWGTLFNFCRVGEIYLAAGSGFTGS